MFRTLAVAASLLAVQTAHAGTWQICDMTVKVNAHLANSREIQATVLKVKAKPEVECPKLGETISFRPERADYQTELAKKHWPKVGRTIRMRYQYLDGVCMGDGNEHQCRIKHHPMLF